MKNLLKKIAVAAVLAAGGLVFAENPPIPEICAWDVTPDHCPAYAKLYPLDYLAGEYTICENLPGMMMMHTNSGSIERKRITDALGGSQLVLELPEFLRLEGVCTYSPVDDKYPRFPRSVAEVPRDGILCRRYTVTLNDEFGKVPPHRYKLQICIHAEPGSAGKSGTIRWSALLGGKPQAERSCPVRVLPPWKPSGMPTENFFPMVWIAATTSDFTAEARTMLDYWGSLSRRVSVYDRRPRATIEPAIYADMNKRFERTMFLMYNHGMIDLNLPDSPQPFYSDVGKGKYRGKLPMNKLRDGRVVNSLPLWYMVEDPDGLYGKYLEEGFRGLGKNYPEIREIIWDYEYNNICYDDGSLERFGKFLGLDRAATVDDILDNPAKFVEWKTVLSCQLVDKVDAAMRKNLPGVRLVMCSTTPKPKKADNSALANAQRYSDKMVDAHLPMTYHAGTAFFDQVKFCTSILKKPFIALNNPAERYSNWFDRYTPRLLKQNIIASAALKCGGFGFWPNDMLTGAYFHAVSEAFADVARAEKFYREGKRADKAVKVAPAVCEVFTVGKDTVAPPTEMRDLKWLVHELDGERLLTILNYSPHAVVVKVTLPEPCGVTDLDGRALSCNGERTLKDAFLAEIPADGYAIYKLGKVVDGDAVPQEPLEAKVAEQSEKLRVSSPFAILRRPDAPVKLKRHFSARYHMLEMNNGRVAVMLDLGRGGHVRGVEFIGVKQLMTGKCHLGKLYFIDAASLTNFRNFVFEGIEEAPGRITAKFSAAVPERDGLEVYSLAGLAVTKRITLTDKDELLIDLEFGNPTDRSITADFRMHNIFCAGESYLHVNGRKLTNRKAPRMSLFTKDGDALPFLCGRVEPEKWNGKAIVQDARRQGVKYRWTVSASDYAGVFVSNSGFFTVEPVSGRFTLKPGEKRSFRFKAKVQLPK